MDRIKSQVQDWMTRQPLTIGPEASAVEAFERMGERGVRRLPVVDGSGRLCGIVTRSDIEAAVPFSHSEEGWRAARFALAGTSVAEVMTGDPLTVTPTATVREVAALMLRARVSGLPVVAGGRLVGIITESDIFRLVVALWDGAP